MLPSRSTHKERFRSQNNFPTLKFRVGVIRDADEFPVTCDHARFKNQSLTDLFADGNNEIAGGIHAPEAGLYFPTRTALCGFTVEALLLLYLPKFLDQLPLWYF